MRTVSMIVFLWVVINQLSIGQTSPATKIYFFSNRIISIRTTRNLDDPVKVSYCTLLETDLDSLGFNITPGKTVYIHFERGHTYYFRSVGGGASVSAQPSLTLSTEQEFWLNAHVYGNGKYRHYSLRQQTGLKLIEEEKK
ncbi:hypothetical protein [Spirosoma sp.]|uniref:hypothetical protein n=1 Tax=Spirosoma sp. TaxID=1899569 RepID=UPI003B3B5F6A